MPESLLPTHTREHLYPEGRWVSNWVPPGDDDLACVGAEYHSPRPLFTQPFSLVIDDWWPDDNDRKEVEISIAPSAPLCGTCRDNVTALLHMIAAADGQLDWKIRREFGNKVRALAEQGWAWYVEHATTDYARGARA